MEVHLSKWQSDVWDDTHRFRVVCAGRRSGKSVLSQLQVIAWANENVGKYWIVAPTYKQAKQIHWEGIQHYVPQKLIEKKNEVDLSVTLNNGSVIELKGAENPDTLRGVKIRGMVIDEIASIRNWNWLWKEVLAATLIDYEAPVLFISTPKGYNHFYELFQIGQQQGNYKSWRFTSYDNPYIKKEEIDEWKKQLTEDTFAQEYMADFRKHTGIAHKPWDRTIHLIDEFEVPKEWNRGRGFDFGDVHYTASVRIAIDHEDNWFVDNSYLDNHKDTKQHAEAILSMDYGLPFVPKWGDPSGKQWMEYFRLHGVNINPADKTVGQGFKGWVEFCVEKINEMLIPHPGHTVRLPDGRVIENAPRMFVLNNGNNDRFVAQIERLSWRQTITGENVPVLDEDGDPTGGHYDLMAALRYFAVSYKKHTVVDFNSLPKYKPADTVIGI
jgi:hypothetical protein